MSVQLRFPWEEYEMADAAERITRLEETVKNLEHTIERNRSEATHSRNNLKQEIVALSEAATRHFEKLEAQLNSLLSILDQAKGAKKTVAAVFAVLSFFGLVGVYQVVSFLTGKH